MQRSFIPALAILALLLAGCVTQPRLIPVDLEALSKLDEATKLVGEGRLSHAPEFIELAVEVHSECYPTPLGASRATDQATARVIDRLRRAIDQTNPQDGVFSRGGYSGEFKRYVGGVTTCTGTFQKSTTVVVKTSRMAAFGEDYAQIQEVILSDTLRRPGGPRGDEPLTYVSFGEPKPQLYHQTRERLEQDALAKAFANARTKFETTAKVACGDSDHRVLKFVEQSADAARAIAYGAAERVQGDGPVQLDAIWINKLLDVYFIVDACSSSAG
jgi:uncharacterized protein YggE